MSNKPDIIVCFPTPTGCRCCVCNNKHCLVDHPGHWCGMPGTLDRGPISPEKIDWYNQWILNQTKEAGDE